jgi:exo-beta-1,3-glucanase (GH17 family)
MDTKKIYLVCYIVITFLCISCSNDNKINYRHISEDILKRKAICYSGYRAGQSPDKQIYPTDDQIKEDLELLIRGGWTFISLLDSGPFTDRVLNVINNNKFDIKILLGIWISNDKNSNHDQIENGIKLCSSYKDIIAAVSVGNDNLSQYSETWIPRSQLIGYIKKVRENITQPVTINSRWTPFEENKKFFRFTGEDSISGFTIQVVTNVDFLTLNINCFNDSMWGWDWKLKDIPENERSVKMADNAINYVKNVFSYIKIRMTDRDINIPILIGEIGWKSQTDVPDGATSKDKEFSNNYFEQYLAHPVNQKMFYDKLMNWIYGSEKNGDCPKTVFYFEAFDNINNKKGHYGLFDINRHPKYVIWNLFPDLKPVNAPNYTEKDALYYRSNR